MKKIIGLILLIYSALGVQSQQPIEVPKLLSDSNSSIPRPVAPKKIVIVPLFYSFSLNPELSAKDVDTFPNFTFHQYNPTRKYSFDRTNLGNLGSASQSLFFDPMPQIGFTSGIRCFDLYKVTADSLRFYKNTRSMSDVAYSRGGKQEDSEFKAKFARTFAGGTNFSLDYRTINNQGQYRYSRTKHQSLAVGLWIPIIKRYEIFLVYAKNTDKQQENGGINDVSGLNDGQFNNPIDLPIVLKDQKALSRHNNWETQLTQHFKLLGIEKKDSSGAIITKSSRTVRLTHTLNFGKQSYKFADLGVRKDSLIFANFEIDKRGLRQFMEYNRVENTFSLTTFKPKGNGERADFISAGLSHRFFKLNQEPFRSKFNQLFVIGSAAFTPSNRFNFLVNGALGLLKSTGDYQLRGDLKLGLGKIGELSGGILSQRTTPAQIEKRLVVSFKEVWNNDFLKPIQNTVFAKYSLNKLGFAAEGRTHLVNNYIYFDQTGQSVQTTAPLQVAQLILHENMQWRALHFDNSVALQRFNRSNVLHIPTWFSRNSLYFQGKAFKKALTLESGVSININSEFKPDSYQPLDWRYNLQDTFSQKPYPMLDVFAGFKVKNFRVFVRVENLSGFWDRKTLYYTTNLYPSMFPAYRLGIRWRFMDTNLPEEGETSNQAPTGAGGGNNPFGGGGKPKF
jgi:Putative porin